MKQQINEIKRMQRLAGLIKENEYPVEVGKPHPSAVTPLGRTWYDLSTGTSVDINENPNHGRYPELTPEEHKEVIQVLKDYIDQYEKNFGGTEYYNSDVVNMAEDRIDQHIELLLNK
jgi:hypothetical protein